MPLNPLPANLIIPSDSEEFGKVFSPPICSICDSVPDDLAAYLHNVNTAEEAARELTKRGWRERDGKPICPSCAKQQK